MTALAMTTIGITSTHRRCYSLLERVARSEPLRLKNAQYLFGRRSMQTHCYGLNALTTTSATDVSWCTRRPRIGFSSNQTCNPINYSSPLFPPNGLMIIRSFGRKGSAMGHHLQNLDAMAHSNSQEEAKHRREEKKKKTKKARLASHKEGNDSSEESTDIDDTMEDGMDASSEDDFVPNVNELGMPLLPESKTIRSKMLLVVANLERSFASIRGGEATPELFDGIRVSVYGETVPLSSVGQVVIEDPQRATISCYDPSVAADVRDAVRDMPGMNLSPYIEEGGSGVIIVPIPRVNEETRKEIVKELGRQAENGRQRVRKIRRSAMDIIKKGKDGKLEGISKDDAFRVGKDVDAVTEEVLSVLNEIVARKQKSVMDD